MGPSCAWYSRRRGVSVCGYISDHCGPPQNVIRGVDHELSELVRWYGTENRGSLKRREIAGNRGQSEKEGNSRKKGEAAGKSCQKWF